MIFFAAAGANLTDLALDEALGIGIKNAKAVSGGIEFEGSAEDGMRYCLYSRLASRLLQGLFIDENVENTDELYNSSKEIPWEEWVSPERTFAISETVVNARWLKNSHYASLVTKDAVCDRIRERFDDQRPSVDKDNPDITFHIHIDGNVVKWYVDFSGKSLCKRGYRAVNTEVYVGEHIAAAVLLRSEWGKRFLRGEGPEPLIDTFAGSGTFIIEAALMESDTAPGLLKSDRFAFLKLPGFDETAWKTIVAEAEERSKNGKEKLKEAIKENPLIGWDIDDDVLDAAWENAAAAGVDEFVEFVTKDSRKLTKEDLPAKCGTLVTDPPYGKRMGATNEVKKLYAEFGRIIPNVFAGWNVSILTGESSLLSYIDLKPERTNTILHGGIPCQLAHYYVFSEAERVEMARRAEEKRQERLATPLSKGAEMAYNRLKKNLDALKKPMEAEGVTCYRIYDADMPEYAAAIDMYEGRWLSLQEYAPPSSIDPDDAERRLEELTFAAERATGIDLENIFVKSRSRQKGASQYNKISDTNRFYLVRENGLRLMVNFQDYLDTGIFLDHRPVRKMIREQAKNKRFLNLFCYTGTATVNAAAGGALSTTSVDASSTYLDWALKNMEDNGFTGMNHFFYRDDCIDFLRSTRAKYDLIFCDPPTFSNSKNRRTFDVQADHPYLIHLAMNHLEKGGKLIFSTNFRRFRLSEEVVNRYQVRDITDETIGLDFRRDMKIHYCFEITEREGDAEGGREFVKPYDTKKKQIKIHLKKERKE